MALNVNGGLFSQSDVRETITNTQLESVAFDTVYARFEGSNELGVGMTDIYINPEGTELYTVDAGDDVKQFTLSTRFNITTATLTYTLDVSARDGDLQGIFFKPDGRKMYVLGADGDSIDEYDLDPAWDLSTATYLQEGSISAFEASPGGIYIREDGRQIYVKGGQTDKVKSIHLSTPWDVTTMTALDEIAFPLLSAGNGGIHFSRKGDVMFNALGDEEIEIWTLTSVFRLATASADTTFTITPNVNIFGIRFNPNGSRMYLSSQTHVYEYSIKRGWR